RAFLWRLQPDDRRDARRRFAGIAVAPGTLDVHRALLGPRLGAHRLELFRRAVTVIGPALREHLARDLGMARRAGELMDDVTIPVEPEPGEPIDDRGHCLGGRAHPVRILDAQPECAALAITLVVARIEPVEQRGAGAADMEKPGRGGGETDDDTHGALCKPCWRAAKSLSRTAGEGACGRRPQTAEERTSALPPLAALACRPLHAKERHKRGPAQLVGRGPR